jgi:TDG/mug DNA glycosylase family protein
MQALRDVIGQRPRILFVGINPGLRSGELRHHFAGKGNPFWRLLAAAHLIDEPIDYETERRLIPHRLALTNLCHRVTRTADELRPDEIARGRRTLLRKIGRLRPRVVALLGVTLYRQVLPKGRTPGPGPKPERLRGAVVFVLPNPSGLNASYPGFADKLIWFERLRELADASPR